MRVMSALLILFGCGDKEGMGSVSGEVAVPERALAADVHWDQAFAYSEGGRLIAFMTGASGASCETVSAYLGPNTGALEKDGILQGGSCTMTIVIDDWDGSASLSWGPEADEGYNPGLSSNLRCEFGDGAWVLETRGSGYEDYYWDGPVWTGIPEVFKWSITGSGEEVSFDLEMSAFDGNFPDELSAERYAAEGDLSGTIRAHWCPDLAEATAL